MRHFTFHREVSHMQKPIYFELEESRNTSLLEPLPPWSDKHVPCLCCSTLARVVISWWNQSHDSPNSSDRYGFQGFALLLSDDWGDFHSDWQVKMKQKEAPEVDQGHVNIHYQGKGEGRWGSVVQQWGSITMKACSWEANGDNEEWNNESRRWNIHIRGEVKEWGSKGKRTVSRIHSRILSLGMMQS